MIDRGPLSDLDYIRKPGIFQVRRCHLGVQRIELQRHQTSAMGQGARQPNGAVAR